MAECIWHRTCQVWNFEKDKSHINNDSAAPCTIASLVFIVSEFKFWFISCPFSVLEHIHNEVEGAWAFRAVSAYPHSPFAIGWMIWLNWYRYVNMYFYAWHPRIFEVLINELLDVKETSAAHQILHKQSIRTKDMGCCHQNSIPLKVSSNYEIFKDMFLNSAYSLSKNSRNHHKLYHIELVEQDIFSRLKQYY
jgi:hypothetical protein